MTVDATGSVETHEGIRVLVVERRYHATPQDVWASVTESARLARWIGEWRAKSADDVVTAGSTVSFVMTAEDAVEPEDVRILRCEPPSVLELEFVQAEGVWHVELEISSPEGRPESTRLVFRHWLGDRDDPSDVGPGWEYYLDRLGAALADGRMPEWDDYFPHQAAHYGGAPTG